MSRYRWCSRPERAPTVEEIHEALEHPEDSVARSGGLTGFVKRLDDKKRGSDA